MIAIDPSINETGWAVRLSHSEYASGVIRTGGAAFSMDERLLRLSQALDAILKRYSLKAMQITVPPPHNYARSTGRTGKAKNSKDIYKLNEAIGAIRLTARLNNIRLNDDIIETHWKRGTNKDYARLYASQTVGREIKNHNEADAICLLEWARSRTRRAE